MPPRKGKKRKERIGAIMRRKSNTRLAIFLLAILITAAVGAVIALGVGRDADIDIDADTEIDTVAESGAPPNYDEPIIITTPEPEPSYIPQPDVYEAPTQEETDMQDPPYLITRYFDITIPYMAHGELRLIGILDFEQGQEYRLSFNFSGGFGAFVGVSNTPIANDAVSWRPFTGGSGSSTVNTFHYGYRYLFVGSRAPANAIDPDIIFTDVTVSVNVLSDD